MATVIKPDIDVIVAATRLTRAYAELLLVADSDDPIALLIGKQIEALFGSPIIVMGENEVLVR